MDAGGRAAHGAVAEDSESTDFIGPSPSGKALGFDLSMRRFESCRPSQKNQLSDISRW